MANATTISGIYGRSLALLTDLYQLTMASSYWKTGVADREAVFHLFFRSTPFRGGFTVASGLTHAIDYLRAFRFDDSDLHYLAGLQGNDAEPLFEKAFLDSLGALEFCCDLDAVPEGSVVFPHEPLIRVRGPLLQAQLMETPLLNIVNFQTLIATKAARISLAARGAPVLEFGLRRAQGIDGALAASWAAQVGGCDATSNVLAGKLFGIPVKGTHAHSWVMCFDTELEAFRAYAEAMPNNCVFLVDTYDTLEGVRKAVEIGRWLRGRGHEMVGIRLDSGDLARLSIESRKILDAAGFSNAVIVASNDLDELQIESLHGQGARIGVWGVGTRLVTAYDQPALGGVYKLAAVRKPGDPWQYKLKLSEQPIKVSNPGVLQVRRFHDGERFVGDMIYDEERGVGDGRMMVDPVALDPGAGRQKIPADTASMDLLVPVFRGGKAVYDSPPLADIRRYAADQLGGFQDGVRRLVEPQCYPVGLEEGLWELKNELILAARETSGRSTDH